jgi:hypothetical protein
MNVLDKAKKDNRLDLMHKVKGEKPPATPGWGIG